MNHQIKKIVIAGTVGAGKTTLVETISDIETVKTERQTSDRNKSIKSLTTVGMDFGRCKVNNNLTLHLYGTPGQSRFNFMWDVLITKADAYILLIPAHRPDDLPEVNKILNFINSKVEIPMIFGITHTDCSGALSINRIAQNIGYGNIITKNLFQKVDARRFNSIKNILKIFSEKLKPKEEITNNMRKASQSFGVTRRDNYQDSSSSLKLREKSKKLNNLSYKSLTKVRTVTSK